MYPEYQNDHYTMTVEDLRKKLKNIPGSAKVYILLDKSEDNWDYGNDQWAVVHPVEKAEKEWVYDVSWGEASDECNCILHLQDPFYENYKVQRK